MGPTTFAVPDIVGVDIVPTLRYACSAARLSRGPIVEPATGRLVALDDLPKVVDQSATSG
jgi:hypothetical protein